MPILQHERLVAADAQPDHWLYVLHGVYGAGRNWATVMRRVVRRRPEWGALLIDLREHGGSRGFAPPHTLAAAAGDLRDLGEATGLMPAGILGHSFGGKVALQYAWAFPEGLEQLWVVDSTPEAGEPRGSAWEMLEVLRSVPASYASRDEAVAALEERGVEHGTALWLSANLERDGRRLHWNIDVDVMEELLRDFFATDLWACVESPPRGLVLHFVQATRSSVLSAGAAEHIRAAGAQTGRVFLHEVEGGHWLNADNPDALVELLSREL